MYLQRVQVSLKMLSDQGNQLYSWRPRILLFKALIPSCIIEIQIYISYETFSLQLGDPIGFPVEIFLIKNLKVHQYYFIKKKYFKTYNKKIQQEDFLQFYFELFQINISQEFFICVLFLQMLRNWLFTMSFS